ncbi:MAG: HAD family hydrolase [Halobacteriota archaeon]
MVLTALSTVLFDLDLTLCVHRQDSDALLSRAFERAGVEQFCGVDEMAAVASDVRTTADESEFYSRCLRAAAERASTPLDADDARDVARAYGGLVDHSDVRFLDGAAAALSAVADDFKLGLVTNGGPESQRQKLDALDIADVFDTHVFADPVYGVKPDAAPFERALDALDSSPGETIHVGDSLAADVAGANRTGIGSVWVPYDQDTPSASDASAVRPRPDYTLDSIGDISSVLDGR